MPKSQFDEFPIVTFEDLKERFPLFREYMLNDFSNTYGIGSDVVGSLDFDNNLADPASISGTTSNTFTLDADDTGGDVSLIFGLTNNEFLKWDDINSRFTLSDGLLIDSDLLFDVGSITSVSGDISFGDENLSTTGTLLSGEHTLSADIVMDNNDITGIGDLTFTDCSVGTVGGIICENLLDKTAAESLSGLYEWTAGGIHLNDNIPFSLGNTSASPDVIIDYDAPNGRLGIDLTTGTRGTAFNITNDISGQAYNISGTGAHSMNRFLDTATGNVLTVSGSSREEATALRALRFLFVHNPNDGESASTVQGVSGDVTIGGNQNTTGTVTGGNFLVIHDSSAIATKIIGASVAFQNTTGEITTSVGLEVCTPTDTAGTWKSNYGIFIEAQDVDLDTEINVGIWLEPSSNASQGVALNAGLVLTGDGVGSDIVFGGGQDAKMYYDGTNLILQSDVVGTGAVKTTAGRIMNTTRLTSVDSPYAVLNTDHIIICDTDGGAIEVDLTAGAEGKEYRISNVGSSGNDVTVDPNGAEEVFSGGAGVAFVMTDTEGITINYNGTEGWW